jgi:hypothetical protein
MAYNWGMGNVDQWIANGSKIEELPKETREYTGKVHGYIGDARNYYETQGRLADSMPYQLSSSGGNPQISHSTNINTVNVNSNPQTVDALTRSVEQQLADQLLMARSPALLISYCFLLISEKYFFAIYFDF